jgi:photosystem II stability/assembly factor-like uncharacterized protein
MQHLKTHGQILVKAFAVATVLALSLVHVAVAADAWAKLSSGSTTRVFLSVWFTSDDVGYVVGDSGTIMKTADGGQHWAALNSGTRNVLYSICFPTPDIGYACGASGTILKTVNAGQTWDTLHAGASTTVLNAIRFCNPRIGYAVGGAETIVRTTDGGSHWTLRPRVDPSRDLWAVSCLDSSTAFVFGDNGNIFKTANGGVDWTNSSIPGFWTSSVHFVTPRQGYLCASSTPWIYKTTDGGGNWARVHDAGTGLGLNFSIWFTDTNTGYVSGSSRISRTIDGGASWDSMATGISGVALYSLCFPSAQTGYAVGTSGTILKLTLSTGNAAPIRVGPRESYLTCRSNTLTCRTPQPATLTICAMDGRMILSRRVAGNGGKVDVSNLPRGMYLAALRSGESVTTLTLTRQ